MSKTQAQVRVPVAMEAVAEFCRRHGVHEFALFGSVLRDDFTERSDVDVLIEPGPDHRHKLEEILAMQEELEAMFGRKVDIVYKHLLKKYIREDVLRQRRVLYVSPQ
ncbi:MAG: nucleotidyltransferase domain-containing protein [Thermaerobacter sp.]|nr:nucleotidyltransferase domain-containing protein [Thermaerobacter sp.]